MSRRAPSLMGRIIVRLTLVSLVMIVVAYA